MTPTLKSHDPVPNLRETKLPAPELAGSNAALRSELRECLARGGSESRVMIGVAVIAASAIAIGTASACSFVAHWGNFVERVHTLLG